MSTHERRNSVALDDAFGYCRRLETGEEPAELFKLCNAICTLDLALSGLEDSPVPMSLCNEAWSRIRANLYGILLSSFKGRFEILDQFDNLIELEMDWPGSDDLIVRFYPDQITRRQDSYDSPLSALSPAITTKLRWCFADRRQDIEPADFAEALEPAPLEEASEAAALLERLYEVCQEQAVEGKKKAHRKWWQLYWQADSCPDKKEKHLLQKQMVALEGIWGRPSQPVV